MKKRFLPIRFFSLLITVIAATLFISADITEQVTYKVGEGGNSISAAKEYLAMLRNNQHTGLLRSA